MSLPVVFRPQAEAELLSAWQWYESHRPGLGDAFRSDLVETIGRVGGRPESFPRVHGEMRRALLRQFPYGVYFQILQDQVVVLGIVHGHRDPRVWRSRR